MRLQSAERLTCCTGSTDERLTPVRLDALGTLPLVQVAAAKFHSAALTADGRLFTWGWGRGGRLGEYALRGCQPSQLSHAFVCMQYI
jgi:alpha-tubulin suppressor-like RCC1 family protein